MDSANSINPKGGGGEANDGGGASSNVIEVTKPAGSDAVTINVRIANGRKFSVEASLESSVKSFKSVIAQHCDIPAEQQRLIYEARLLKDDRTLKSYDLEAEHTVHLVRAVLPAASTITSTSGTFVYCNSSGSDTSSNFTYYNQFPESEVLRRVRDSPEMIAAVNRDPYLARNINNPDIFRQRVEDRIYAELIREMYQYNINSILHPDGGDDGDGGLTVVWTPLFCQPEQQQSASDHAGQMDEGTVPGSTTPDNNSNVGPEQLYASQLAQLQGLSFFDSRQNLEALTATAGSVPSAVHRLLVNNMILDDI